MAWYDSLYITQVGVLTDKSEWLMETYKGVLKVVENGNLVFEDVDSQSSSLQNTCRISSRRCRPDSDYRQLKGQYHQHTVEH